jgi:hypothetical protein
VTRITAFPCGKEQQGNQEERRTRWPRGFVTSRISAIRQTGKPAILSVGNESPGAQRASDSSFLLEQLNPQREINEPASRAGLTAGAPRPLWQLGIVEITGHNLEAHGREDVNRLLHEGWHLLHIYTLKYRDEGVWRERPMAILGRSQAPDEKDPKTEVGPPAGASFKGSPGATEQDGTKSPAPPASESGRGAGRRLRSRSGHSEEGKE